MKTHKRLIVNASWPTGYKNLKCYNGAVFCETKCVHEHSNNLRLRNLIWKLVETFPSFHFAETFVIFPSEERANGCLENVVTCMITFAISNPTGWTSHFNINKRKEEEVGKRQNVRKNL